MSAHILPTVEIELGDHIDASVIWLHGLGADGHDFKPIIPDLGLPQDAGIRFVFPHAPVMPVTINDGYIMPAWYDITHQDFKARDEDHAGIHNASAMIQRLIEREQMRGINIARIILAGFSQGGAMALHVGLRQSTPLAGIIALSCYLLMPDQLPDALAHCKSTPPIFMAHGTSDPIVPYSLAECAKKSLQAVNVSVQWQSWPMAHAVCPEEIIAIGTWIRSRLLEESGARPGQSH
ncbi:MAG: alpha/beta hydrolase [Mariprofundaceae bacterium]